MSNIRGCVNTFNQCFTSEPGDCPIDTYGTKTQMTVCAVFSRAKVQKPSTKVDAECLACPTVDKNWNKHINGYCKHGKKQDCLCMRPDLVDPILEKIWGKIPAFLRNKRRTWYLPCLVKNYLRTSDLPTGDLKTICTELEPILKKELSASDFTEIKTRMRCFNNVNVGNNGNGGNGITFWDKHKVFIIISIVALFFILIIIVAVASSGKKKKKTTK